jgi:CDP-diacylglycerol--glycerol-3-phosphate 3-phosphatidyltransferase
VGAGLYAAKPWLQRRLGSLADRLAAADVHPDTLTAAAVGCALAGGTTLALCGERPWLAAMAAPLAAARIALNALDGMVAQRRGLARAWGKVLNEVGDRLADLAFLGGLALVPGVDLRAVTAATIAALLSSHLGVLAEAAGGRRLYGGVMGKADRMLWLALAALVAGLSGSLTPLHLLPWVLFGGCLITSAQRGRRARGDLESVL